MIQVRKNSGDVVSFDKSKVSIILKKAGLSETESDDIAGKIEEWATKAEGAGVVTTRQIKQKVLEIIPRDVAMKIRNYVKSKRQQQS